MIHLNVSEFNHMMTTIIQDELSLNALCLSGIIREYRYAGDHLYLTLMHNESCIPCVMYHHAKKSTAVIKRGAYCDVIGQCRFLRKRGQLVFSVHRMTIQSQRTTQLDPSIATFQSAGHFMAKQPHMIPETIHHVGIITAIESAAHADINHVFGCTPHPFCVTFIPSCMQGPNAPHALKHALHTAVSLQPDIIGISRGGGADLDFECFNHESLGHAIIASPIPIITGIGHHINTTLACLCANQFFSTPTAMAQFLCQQAMIPIHAIQQELDTIYQHIMRHLHQDQHTIDSLQSTLQHCMDQTLKSTDHMMQSLTQTLHALNPLNRLKNGFIYGETIPNIPLASIQTLSKNDIIELTLLDGKVTATIDHVYSRSH